MGTITHSKKNILISLFFLILVIIVNFISTKGFINGHSQSYVSSSFPTLLTPSGFTFSIWILIYALLFISLVINYVKNNEYYNNIIDNIAVLFWISSILNILWIIAFSYMLIAASFFIILAFVAVLFIIIIKLNKLNQREKGIYDIAFGFYAGWVSIATIVNFLIYLLKNDCSCFGNYRLFCTVLLFIYVVVIIGFQIIHKNPVFNISVAWGFFGIIKRLSFYTYLDVMFIILSMSIIIFILESLLSFKRTKWKI